MDDSLLGRIARRLRERMGGLDRSRYIRGGEFQSFTVDAAPRRSEAVALSDPPEPARLRRSAFPGFSSRLRRSHSPGDTYPLRSAPASPPVPTATPRPAKAPQPKPSPVAVPLPPADEPASLSPPKTPPPIPAPKALPAPAAKAPQPKPSSPPAPRRDLADLVASKFLASDDRESPRRGLEPAGERTPLASPGPVAAEEPRWGGLPGRIAPGGMRHAGTFYEVDDEPATAGPDPAIAGPTGESSSSMPADEPASLGGPNPKGPGVDVKSVGDRLRDIQDRSVSMEPHEIDAAILEAMRGVRGGDVAGLERDFLGANVSRSIRKAVEQITKWIHDFRSQQDRSRQILEGGSPAGGPASPPPADEPGPTGLPEAADNERGGGSHLDKTEDAWMGGEIEPGSWMDRSSLSAMGPGDVDPAGAPDSVGPESLANLRRMVADLAAIRAEKRKLGSGSYGMIQAADRARRAAKDPTGRDAELVRRASERARAMRSGSDAGPMFSPNDLAEFSDEPSALDPIARIDAETRKGGPFRAIPEDRSSFDHREAARKLRERIARLGPSGLLQDSAEGPGGTG